MSVISFSPMARARSIDGANEARVHQIRVIRFTAFFERAQGLLLREHLLDQFVVALSPCRAIHTVGMRWAIDVAFLDRFGKVLEIRERLRPLRFSFARSKETFETLELAAGQIRAKNIRPGDFCMLQEDKSDE